MTGSLKYLRNVLFPFTTDLYVVLKLPVVLFFHGPMWSVGDLSIFTKGAGQQCGAQHPWTTVTAGVNVESCLPAKDTKIIMDVLMAFLWKKDFSQCGFIGFNPPNFLFNK